MQHPLTLPTHIILHEILNGWNFNLLATSILEAPFWTRYILQRLKTRGSKII